MTTLHLGGNLVADIDTTADTRALVADMAQRYSRDGATTTRHPDGSVTVEFPTGGRWLHIPAAGHIDIYDLDHPDRVAMRAHFTGTPRSLNRAARRATHHKARR